MRIEEVMKWSRNEWSTYDRTTIRKFMEEQRALFKSGVVLDFGCGKRPYEDLVSSDTYIGYDPVYPQYNTELPEVADTIIANQVFESISNPIETLKMLFDILTPGGYLVTTYNSTWFEWGINSYKPGFKVNQGDFYRFTKWGMEKMLKDIGFNILVHREKWNLQFRVGTLTIGYGLVAQKPERRS